MIIIIIIMYQIFGKSMAKATGFWYTAKSPCTIVHMSWPNFITCIKLFSLNNTCIILIRDTVFNAFML